MDKYLSKFIQILLKTKSSREMHDFLKAALTPQELNMIPKRLEIIRYLKKGVDHRTIATKLGVGIATVTRGSNDLKKNNKIWEKAIIC